MKNIKKVLAIALAVSTIMGVSACGKKEPNNGEKIVIYTGGSSEFLWREGSDEKAVWKAVEDKYKKDTGIALDFEVNFMGKDMKDKVTTAISGKNQVDLMISHTSGGSGIDDWMYYGRNYYDIYDYIATYGENIIANSVWQSGDVKLDGLERLYTTAGEVIGIPSVISPYKFGILVRKDMMEECGYTDDAEKAKSGNYTLVNDLLTFEAMAKKMVEVYSPETKGSMKYAVTGAIFDLEKVGLVGAFGLDAGYYTNTVYNYEGEDYVIPGGGQEAYKEILALENRWAKEGVISRQADSITVDQGESYFIAGSTGIFVQDPTITHLIEVVRKCKKANPQAEFTVLGALPLSADENSDEYKKYQGAKGFMRNSVATFAACIPNVSKQAKNIVKFVDWMYSKEENYLLCKYGIEGKHWVNNGNGTFSFKEPYSITNPAYSGVLSFVDNQNVSNLVCANYTQEELKWLDIAGDKSNYINNPTIDVLLLTKNETYNSGLWAAYNEVSGYCNQCWHGLNTVGDISTEYPNKTDKFMADIKERGTAMLSIYSQLKGALKW